MMVRGHRLQVSVLGPVHVERDGAEVALGARLERLLAVLTVSVHHVVSVDRLVDAVWGDDVPRQAETSLKSYVTRLRHAVGDDTGQRIVFRRPGYRLDLAPDELDSVLFEQELDTARLQLRLADDEEAAATLARALARWRGRPYGELGDEEWCRTERVRLEELHSEARALHVEALLGAGRLEVAVAEARALVEDEPLRDRPRALLMRVLHASGRQAEALRVVPAFRRYLGEEMGLDVSPELVELEARIARRDASVGSGARPLRGYELAERLGEGAFAVVHRGVQPGVSRDVAIKIIRSELADRPEFVRRFEAEAQLVARLEHPNIVPIHDFWREPGAAYLVMRFLRGGTAEQSLRRHGAWSRQQVVRLATEIGGALEYAHRRGIVHRDVRPANILLDDDSNAYLSDFGIARPTNELPAGELLSPAYSAPEVLRGEPVGPQADILSLAVSVYELITGRLPFADATDRADLVRHQLQDPLPPVTSVRRDLPSQLDEVLARATAKAPADRYASVASFVSELSQALGDGRAADRPAPARRPVSNPYVGLRAFGEADAATFHGREAHVVQLVDALEAHRFVALVGGSGSGKSSLVRAGLLPALRRNALPGSCDWFVTTMVPGADPFAELEAALLRVALRPPASLGDQLRAPGGLRRAVGTLAPSGGAAVLLVVDQLEELFGEQVDQRSRSQFLAALGDAVAHEHCPLRVVVTLRADRFDEPLQHPAIADVVAAGTVPLRPMTPGELELAIVGPARSVGVELEPSLVAELVAAAHERPGALPLLQFTLTELFERRAADVMLLSAYREVGGLTGTLAGRAERVLDELGPGAEIAARALFGRLVHVGGGAFEARRRVVRSELEHDEATTWLIEAMVAARLLVTDRHPETRAPTLEVAHEALLHDWPRLRSWLDEDRDDLASVRWVSSAAAAWEAGGRDPADLGRGRRLEAAVELRDRRGALLAPGERAWVDAAEAQAVMEEAERSAQLERERLQHQRLRRAVVGIVALLVVVSVAASVAVEQRGSAVRNAAAALAARDDAEVERLLALSAAQAPVDLGRSILLALAAHERRADPVTQGAVLSALAQEPRVHRVVPSFLEEESLVQLSADGRVGVEWSIDRSVGRIAVFDVDSGRLRRPVLETTAGVGAVGLAGDGAQVAWESGGVIHLLDTEGDAEARTFAAGGEVWELLLDRAGEVLVAGGLDHIEVVRTDRLEVIDVVEVPRPQSLVPWSLGGALSLSADGRRVAYAFDEDVFGEGERTGARVVEVGGDLLFEHLVEGGLPMTVRLSPSGARLGVVLGHVPTAHEVLLADVASGAVEPRGTFDDGGVALDLRDDGSLTAVAIDGTLRFHDASGGAAAPPARVPVQSGALVHRADGMVVIGRVGGGYVTLHEHLSPLFDAAVPVGPLVRLAPSGRSVTWVGDDGRTLWRTALASPSGAPRQVADLGDVLVGPAWFLQVSHDGGAAVVGGPTESGPALVVIDPAGATRPVDLDGLYGALFGEPFLDTAPIVPRIADGGDRLFVRATLRSGQVRAVWVDVASLEITAGPIDLDSGQGPVRVLSDGRALAGAPGTAAYLLAADLSHSELVGNGDLFAVPLAEHPPSSLVALGGLNGELTILDVATGEVRALEPAGGYVSDAAFSPDGTLLAVRDVASGISVRDVATGRSTGAEMAAGIPGIESGMAWDEHGRSVWFPTAIHVVRLVLDPARWLELACEVAGRELTADEWSHFVSDERPPSPLCSST